MEKRKLLVADIEKFISNNLKLYNEEQTVNKSEYLSLIERSLLITEEDFENSEKGKGYLKFLNNPDRRMKRELLKRAFNGDSLENAPFLDLIDSLLRIADWLK